MFTTRPVKQQDLSGTPTDYKSYLRENKTQPEYVMSNRFFISNSVRLYSLKLYQALNTTLHIYNSLHIISFDAVIADLRKHTESIKQLQAYLLPEKDTHQLYADLLQIKQRFDQTLLEGMCVTPQAVKPSPQLAR